MHTLIRICIGKLLTDLTQGEKNRNRNNKNRIRQTKIECKGIIKKKSSNTFIIHGVYWFWLSLIAKMRAMAMSAERLRRKCICATEKQNILLLRHLCDTKRPRSGQHNIERSIQLTLAHLYLRFRITLNIVHFFFFSVCVFFFLSRFDMLTACRVQFDS